MSASRIEFRGAAQVSPETLAAIVRAGQLETLSWADTEPLARAVQEAYRARGLLEAAVEVGDPERVGGELVLPVTIAEGPVFRVGAVTLVGVAARPEAAVRGLIGFSAGDPYLPARLQEARNRILASYRQAGFNAVRVSLESAVDQTAASVAVGYRVEEGPRQVIEAIEVVGAHRTRPDVVARALALTPGQPADLAEWNRARKRLYDLGVFRSVDLEPEPVGTADDGATERVQVNVLLEEWPAYRWRYGLRVEDVQLPLSEAADRDVRLGFVSDLTRENFLGRAGTLGTALRWDADRRIVRGFATLRTMFGLPLSSNLFLSGRRERVGEPAANRYADIARATLEQRVRPRQGVTVAYSYSFERNHTFVEAVAPDGVPDPDETVDLARLNASLAIDRRDDAFNATRGWFHGSSLEYGVTGLGSDLRFVKFTAQQFHYWPVGHGVVLASAGRIGLGKGFDQELIRSERFFAGGVNTVRGFSHNSLGPTVEGDAVGGNALVVLNQELRFPVWGRLGGAAFVDAGSVFGTVRAIALPDLEVGAGVGLRVDTPFGLFRVDFARPVSDIERSRRRAFFFSFGHVF